jgi:hypothetical protein
MMGGKSKYFGKISFLKRKGGLLFFWNLANRVRLSGLIVNGIRFKDFFDSVNKHAFVIGPSFTLTKGKRMLFFILLLIYYERF